MAEHDEDPDRAAILARRRQFIAVALGGLAMGCGPTKPTPKPNTTGESGTQSETSTTGEESESGTETSGSELKLDQPPDSWTDTETDGGGGETGPRPCLTPPGFKP